MSVTPRLTKLSLRVMKISLILTSITPILTSVTPILMKTNSRRYIFLILAQIPQIPQIFFSDEKPCG